MRIPGWFLLAAVLTCVPPGAAQPPTRGIRTVELGTSPGLVIRSVTTEDGQTISWRKTLPLFSLEINDTIVDASQAHVQLTADSLTFSLPFGIEGSVKGMQVSVRGWRAEITLQNGSAERRKVSNLVPLGAGSDRVYIDAARGPLTGPGRLDRSRLYRPGVGPIGVVLPDNAWELGFCDVRLADTASLVAIARRVGSTAGDVRRFHTMLNPAGTVTYAVHADVHGGQWQTGLQLMLRDRWLYDLEQFDNALFERKDLEWIRHSYTMLLQFAWDQTYYSPLRKQYLFDSMLTAANKLIGGYDVFLVWPTWPRLGIDERNQFDMYRDLPGGLKELRRQVEFAHRNGTKYFIAYNPWDASTRMEDHTRGMEDLLRTLDADGICLDTRGESSKELQDMGDRVKPGVIMYSEGMAVPKDMPGIVAGRVHDALFMPPPLNLNKFIKPDFAIFRVLQVTEGKIHREVAVAFFNGYGCEINIMRPGRPDWIDEEMRTLGRTTKILRENSSAFLSADWLPLLPSLQDSIWVNRWPAKRKTLYTIYSLRPEGYAGALFEAPAVPGYHYVDLWRHEEINIAVEDGAPHVPVNIDGFNRSALRTREEGSVGCIAHLPALLTASVRGDSLTFSASEGTRILVWAGMPSYDRRSVAFPAASRRISLREHLGTHEEKFVVQLFDDRELLDERVLHVPLATPRLISPRLKTTPARTAPTGMVEIPGGEYTFQMTTTFEPNPVVPYPDYTQPTRLRMNRFYIDRYPVTNADYREFIDATRYRPADTANYLKHWIGGRVPKGLQRHPVVWVSQEDARAYARWAGKRLPTTIEWQYAAQGTDGRKFPWGMTFDSTRCNNATNVTTPVDAFPNGASPFGVQDLVGNVWQMTDELYDNGSYVFGLLRGGSCYYPRSSEWYVKGGPWPVDQQQMLLMISPGFDRNSTVGFRCVKDAD